MSQNIQSIFQPQNKMTQNKCRCSCAARSQEMVRGCQAWKADMVHSLRNYTHFKHNRLMLTGILCNFRDRCSLSSSYSLTAAKKKKKLLQQICHAQVAHTQAVLWHAPSAVSIISIMPEESVCFRCSDGYSLNKSARVPANSSQLHVTILAAMWTLGFSFRLCSWYDRLKRLHR